MEDVCCSTETGVWWITVDAGLNQVWYSGRRQTGTGPETVPEKAKDVRDVMVRPDSTLDLRKVTNTANLRLLLLRSYISYDYPMGMFHASAVREIMFPGIHCVCL